MKPAEQLTLLPEASHDYVNLSALPGSDEARRTTATSGRKCSALLPKSDPVGCLVKTLLASSIWRSTRSALSLKRGEALRVSASACSFERTPLSPLPAIVAENPAMRSNMAWYSCNDSQMPSGSVG